MSRGVAGTDLSWTTLKSRWTQTVAAKTRVGPGRPGSWRRQLSRREALVAWTRWQQGKRGEVARFWVCLKMDQVDCTDRFDGGGEGERMRRETPWVRAEPWNAGTATGRLWAGQVCAEGQELSFGPLEFVMPIRCSNGVAE